VRVRVRVHVRNIPSVDELRVPFTK